jgi:hypothetical protein
MAAETPNASSEASWAFSVPHTLTLSAPDPAPAQADRRTECQPLERLLVAQGLDSAPGLAVRAVLLGRLGKP